MSIILFLSLAVYFSDAHGHASNDSDQVSQPAMYRVLSKALDKYKLICIIFTQLN